MGDDDQNGRHTCSKRRPAAAELDGDHPRKAQNGIAEKTYYYWLRKVRQSTLERTTPELVQLEADQPAPERMIRIRYGSAELNLPETVVLAAVAALLDSLRHG